MAEIQGDMKKRLVQFATEHLGITVHRFEKSCGLSNSYCSNPNAVGSYAKKKIMVAYPELNMDWIITGKGEILNTTNLNLDENTRNKRDGKLDGEIMGEIKELRKELELYKMLYEKEHNESKAMSEQIGALKAEVEYLKKEEIHSKTESVNVRKKRKAS